MADIKKNLESKVDELDKKLDEKISKIEKEREQEVKLINSTLTLLNKTAATTYNFSKVLYSKAIKPTYNVTKGAIEIGKEIAPEYRWQPHNILGAMLMRVNPFLGVYTAKAIERLGPKLKEYAIKASEKVKEAFESTTKEIPNAEDEIQKLETEIEKSVERPTTTKTTTKSATKITKKITEEKKEVSNKIISGSSEIPVRYDKTVTPGRLYTLREQLVRIQSIDPNAFQPISKVTNKERISLPVIVSGYLPQAVEQFKRTETLYLKKHGLLPSTIEEIKKNVIRETETEELTKEKALSVANEYLKQKQLIEKSKEQIVTKAIQDVRIIDISNTILEKLSLFKKKEEHTGSITHVAPDLVTKTKLAALDTKSREIAMLTLMSQMTIHLRKIRMVLSGEEESYIRKIYGRIADAIENFIEDHRKLVSFLYGFYRIFRLFTIVPFKFVFSARESRYRKDLGKLSKSPLQALVEVSIKQYIRLARIDDILHQTFEYISQKEKPKTKELYGKSIASILMKWWGRGSALALKKLTEKFLPEYNAILSRFNELVKEHGFFKSIIRFGKLQTTEERKKEIIRKQAEPFRLALELYFGRYLERLKGVFIESRKEETPNTMLLKGIGSLLLKLVSFTKDAKTLLTSLVYCCTNIDYNTKQETKPVAALPPVTKENVIPISPFIKQEEFATINTTPQIISLEEYKERRKLESKIKVNSTKALSEMAKLPKNETELKKVVGFVTNEKGFTTVELLSVIASGIITMTKRLGGIFKIEKSKDKGFFMSLLGKIGTFLTSTFTSIFSGIKGFLLNVFLSKFIGRFSGLFKGLLSGLSKIGPAISGLFSKLPKLLTGVLGGAFGKLGKLGGITKAGGVLGRGVLSKIPIVSALFAGYGAYKGYDLSKNLEEKYGKLSFWDKAKLVVGKMADETISSFTFGLYSPHLAEKQVESIKKRYSTFAKYSEEAKKVIEEGKKKLVESKDKILETLKPYFSEEAWSKYKSIIEKYYQSPKEIISRLIEEKKLLPISSSAGQIHFILPKEQSIIDKTIKKTVEKYKETKEFITNVKTEKLQEKIVPKIKEFKEEAVSVYHKLYDFAIESWKKFWKGSSKTLEDKTKDIQKIKIKDFKKTLDTVYEDTVNYWNEFWKSHKDNLVNIVKDSKDRINTIINNIKNFLKNYQFTIKEIDVDISSLSSLFSELKERISKLSTNLKETLLTRKDDLISYWNEFWTKHQDDIQYLISIPATIITKSIDYSKSKWEEIQPRIEKSITTFYKDFDLKLKNFVDDKSPDSIFTKTKELTQDLVELTKDKFDNFVSYDFKSLVPEMENLDKLEIKKLKTDIEKKYESYKKSIESPLKEKTAEYKEKLVDVLYDIKDIMKQNVETTKEVNTNLVKQVNIINDNRSVTSFTIPNNMARLQTKIDIALHYLMEGEL